MLIRIGSSFLILSTLSPNLETQIFSASKLKQIRGVVSCEICKASDGFKYIEIEGLNGYLDYQGLYLCNEAVQISRAKNKSGVESSV